MNKVVFLLFLFVGLVVCVAVAVWPLSQAKARQLDARNAGLARIAAAEAAAAEARAETTAAERTAVSPYLVAVGRVSLVVVAVVVVAVGAGVAVVAVVVAYGQVQQNRRLAALPVTRQIAERAYVFQADDGRYWLLDGMSGRRALLSSAADVDALRAGIVREQVILQELGRTAVEVSRLGDGHGQPALDWIFSQAMQRIANRIEVEG